MKQRPNYILYAFYFVAFIVSCNKNIVKDERLLLAESLMTFYPDSSHQILQSFSPESLSKPEQMYYGLLLTEAIDKKNLSLLPCDSLLNEAVSYYSDGINRAKALMYKGRLQFRMNMYEKAIENYFAALQELGKVDKDGLRIKGMIYEDLGSLYSNQVLIEKSIEMFRRAEDCYMRCNYEKGLFSVDNHIGWNLLLKADTAGARKYMKRNLASALKQKDSVMLSAIYYNLSCTYESIDSVLYYGKLSLDTDNRLAFKAAIMVGYVFLDKEEVDSAEYYFRHALGDMVIETRASAFYGLKGVMEMKGEFEQALNFFDSYSSAMDSIYFFQKNSEIKKTIYEYEAKMTVNKHWENMRKWLLSVIMICLLIIISSIWRIRRTKRQKKILHLEHERSMASLKANITKFEDHIALLRKELEQDKLQISHKDFSTKELADEKVHLCNFVFKQTAIYKKIELLSQQKKTKNKYELRILLEDEQQQLRLTVADIYKDYIACLRQLHPKYTEDDCLYSCLSLCGWDDLTIALCFGNVNRQIIVQRRHRMKLKSTYL